MKTLTLGLSQRFFTFNTPLIHRLYVDYLRRVAHQASLSNEVNWRMTRAYKQLADMSPKSISQPRPLHSDTCCLLISGEEETVFLSAALSWCFHNTAFNNLGDIYNAFTVGVP